MEPYMTYAALDGDRRKALWFVEQISWVTQTGERTDFFQSLAKREGVCVRDAIREKMVLDGIEPDAAKKIVDDTWPEKFNPGDRVLANFLGITWYEASITQANNDGSYDIVWDDGLDVRNKGKTTIALIPFTFVDFAHHCIAKIEASDQLGHDTLPRWSFTDDGVSTSIRFVVGPVIPWLRAAGVGNIVTQILGLLALLLIAGKGRSAYPNWIWGIFLPGLALKMFVEFKSLQMFLVPYVCSVKAADLVPFKVMGFMVSFNVWFIIAVTCSFLLTLDLATDTLFFASAIMSPNQENMDKVYAITFQTQQLESWRIPCPSLQLMMWGAFIVSLLQMVIPLVTIYRQGEHTLCRNGVDGRGMSKFTGTIMFNDTVFLAMVEPAQVGTVQTLAITAGRASLLSAPPAEEFQGPNKALQRVAELGDQMRGRVALSYVGENCLQLYLQTIVFMIVHFLTLVDGKEEDFATSDNQKVASIVVSTIMTLTKLSEAFGFLRVAADAEKIRDTTGARASGETEVDDENLRRVRRSAHIVTAGCAIMVLSLVFTMCKLAAVYHCESSMWNVSSIFNGSFGCLDVAMLEKALKSTSEA